MRKTFCFVSALSAVIAIAVGACGGDDTGSTADSGSDVQSMGDTFTPADAAGDGAKAPTTATITVYQGATPFAGAKVVFYKPDGTAQPTMTTGVDGKATATVDKGASVTAAGLVATVANSTRLTSFIGIEPGDDLSAYVDELPPDAAAPPFITISDPGTYASASNYLFSNGCDSATEAAADVSSGASFAVTSNCETGGKVSVIVYALDSSGVILGYTQSANLTFTSGMTVSGLSASWTAATTQSLTTSGAPPSGGIGSADLSFITGVAKYGFFGAQSLPSDGGGITFDVPGGSFLTNHALQTTFLFPSAPGQIAFVGDIAQAAFGDPLSVDFGVLPPEVHSASVTSDGNGGVTLSFTAEGAIASLDGMEAQFSWSASDPADASTSDYFSWTVIAPPNTTTVLPELSNDLVAVLPSISQPAFQGLTAKKGTPFGSYAGYRKNAHAYDEIGAPMPAPYSYAVTAISLP